MKFRLPAKSSDDLLRLVAAKHPMFPSAVITSLETFDVRFPTSRDLDGSDAMNPDPDYSAAYVVLRTDAGDGLEGHGFAFTIGRGNDVQVAAIARARAVRRRAAGRRLRRPGRRLAAARARLAAALARAREGRHAHGDRRRRQRALGPGRQARAASRCGSCWPTMSPEALVDARRLPLPHRRADPPRRRWRSCGAAERGRPSGRRSCARDGYPAYTTSPGWLGYSDEKLTRLCARGGRRRLRADQAEGRRGPRRRRPPLRIAREACRPGHPHRRSTPTSAGTSARRSSGSRRSAEFDAVLDRGADEPRRRPRARRDPGAPSRRCRSRPASTCRTGSCSSSCCRPRRSTSCRSTPRGSAGVNENIAILLLAAKFGVPVCPHAGGVGLCELVQHLSMFDFVAVSGTLEDRVIEYVDHLHEHFVDPVGGASAGATAPRPRRASRAEMTGRGDRPPDALPRTGRGVRRHACQPASKGCGRSSPAAARASAWRPRGCWPAQGARWRCWTWTRRRRSGRAASRSSGRTSPTTPRCARRSRRRRSARRHRRAGQQRGHRRARARSRTTPTSEWQTVYDVNVVGMVRVTRAALPWPARVRARRDRQHLLDRRHRRAAAARALQRRPRARCRR